MVHRHEWLKSFAVPVKDAEGLLLADAIPMVIIFKSSNWLKEEVNSKDPASAVDILARLGDYLAHHPLAGLVGGHRALWLHDRAHGCGVDQSRPHGFPVLKVARGNAWMIPF